MTEPPIDINSDPFEFDSQTNLTTPGAWYVYGVSDGLNSFDKRTLTPPFDVFQGAYDDGFDHGTYNRTYLIDPRP